MKDKLKVLGYGLTVSMVLTSWVAAVTSEMTRHSTAAELLKGKTEQTQIDSDGTIRLARQSKTIDCGTLLEKVWSINALVIGPDGGVYLGTSPNGQIFRVLEGHAEVVYPKPEGNQSAEESHSASTATRSEAADTEAKPETEQTEPMETVANEHVYALTMDSGDRLLAGVSGKQARLIRLDTTGQALTLFEPAGANYIHAMALDGVGNIYLGTGPEGKVFRLDPFGQNPQEVFSVKDRNVLSLAVDDKGVILAGSDKRGIIYRYDPAGKALTVVFDSEQNEVASLAIDEFGTIYAATTSAEVTREKIPYNPVSSDAASGRTDDKGTPKDKAPATPATTELKIANTEKPAPAPAPAQAPKRGTLPKTAGHIYRIDPRGYVTDLFSDMSVLYSMKRRNAQLLLATGNSAQLFSVDPETEKRVVEFEEKQCSQITAMALDTEAIYLGCSNPAKLIRLSDSFATEGTYLSELVDAGQPARWGRMQTDAVIPEGCSVWFSARSGNINEPDDPTYSPWTPDVEVKDSVGIECPVGRFCQYRLTLKTNVADQTPRVDAVALSHVVGNLSPVVSAVNVSRVKGKPGVFQTAFEAADRNKDTLVFRLELRRQGRTTWIKLKDELTANNFEWDSQTVEDGRYELRVTADDRRSNSDTTSLTGSRISEVFVVDNTPPDAKDIRTKIEADKVIVRLTVEDALSAIGSVNYTVDSNEKWMGTLPDDLVFDTTREAVTMEIKNLSAGPHVLAIKMADDVGNTAYRTLDIEIPKDGTK